MLLLLLVPAGASAATPSGLLGQTVASVNDVVTQVDGVVTQTVLGAQQALRSEVPAEAVPTTPADNPALHPAIDRTATTAETIVAGATGVDVTAEAAPVTAARPARARREAHRGEPASPAPRSTDAATPDQTAPAYGTSAPSQPVAGRAPNAPAPELPSTSGKPAGPSPAGPALSAGSGAGVASAAFSTGAAAILLTLLLLAASALKTRLPRFDEVGRPPPLVFALERPG